LRENHVLAGQFAVDRSSWHINVRTASLATMNVGRLGTSLLAVVLMLGMIVHAVGGTDIVVQSAPATVSHVSMPGGCNGCGSAEHGTSAACDVLCSGVMAVPTSVTAVETGASIFSLSIASLAGRRGPPDPYPPRPIEMS
jgi:Fe-S cluster biogenesis protein NfuA